MAWRCLATWLPVLAAQPCQVSPSPNMGYPPCVEGLTVPDGGVCTPRCVTGFTAYENQLTCTNGNLSLGGAITCLPDCLAPVDIPDAAAVACEEGSTIPEGSHCTPTCADGWVPVDGTPLLCRNGRLRGSFSCRLMRCTMPRGPFSDENNQEVPFDNLKGAQALWSQQFPPPNLDYPAEEICDSASTASTNRRGCSTCYSPLQTIEVAVPSIDGLSRLLLAFEGQSGRHLALVFEEIVVTWTSDEGFSTVEELSVFPEDFQSLDGEVTEDLWLPAGTKLTHLFVNDWGQLDSGPDPSLAVSGLEPVYSVAALRTLAKPNGASAMSLRMVFKYTVPGCRLGTRGSVAMALALQSLVVDVTRCGAGDVSTCNVTCSSFASGQATVECLEDGGTFTFTGCSANCAALPAYNPATNLDGVLGAAEVSCAQGSYVLHGEVCTPVCEQGLMSDVTELQCNDSAFLPSTFACVATCSPPNGGLLAASPPCEEMNLQQVLRTCHAQCQPGYRPRWLETEADPVSPPELVLTCHAGELHPVSAFECQPIWLEMLTMPSSNPRWTGFMLPANEVSWVLLRSTADPEFRSVMDGFLLEWQGDDSESLGLRAVNFSAEAQDAVALWSGASLLVITTRLRQSTASGQGCAAVLMAEPTTVEDVEQMVEVQHLPLVELPGPLRVLGTSSSLVLLAPGVPGRGAPGSMGACSSEANISEVAELPAVYLWDGQRFEEFQRLDYGATVLEAFVFGEQLLVFAAGQDEARIYSRALSADDSFQLQNSSGDLQGILAAEWLGCRDDPGFLDAARRLPCWQLSPADCSKALVQRFCGALCGCPHGDALLAVGFQQRLAVLSVEGLTEVASHLSASPVVHLAALYAPALAEHFLVAAGDGGSGVFAWRGGRLRHVQQLPGGAALPLAAENVTLMMTAGADVSRLYAVDGAFEWFAGAWGNCNGTCSGKDFIFRHRKVACRSMPSGLWHSEGCLGEAPVAEERCRGLEPCPKDSFSWVIGLWGPCEGLCGEGLRHRNLTCLRQLVAANGSAVGEAIPAVDSDCPTPPSAELPCPLKACGTFRLRNRVAVQSAWHVVEVAFFVDIDCKQQVHGLPVASGRCADCVCYNISRQISPCGPDLAFDGFWDASRLQGSQWISQCVEQTPACAPGEAWIGLQVQATSDVRCVKLLQSADPAYMSREVSLEAMDGGTWKVLAEYANLQGAIILEDGNYSWDVLVVPQACSSTVHCSGNGDALGLPGSCSCACRQGFAGASCNMCAVGFLEYPDCAPELSSSRIWRVMGLGKRSWHVQDLAFFQADDCSAASAVPVSASTVYLSSFPEAVDPQGHRRAFDEAPGTTWIGNCDDCGDAGPWVGLLLEEEVTVRCLRLRQGQGDFGATDVALDLWLGTWTMAEVHDTNDSNDTSNSANVSAESANVSIKASNSTSNRTGWWRLRTWSYVDTSGEDPVTLQLICDVGLPASQHVLHNCEHKRPWQECMAWCEPGYSGTATMFLCIEDYSFRGHTPICVPEECRLGIPTKVGLIIAEGCTGLRTGDTCVASCTTGLTGADLQYKCSADGYLRESKSGQVGVVPSCASTFTETLETATGAALPCTICRLVMAVTLVALRYDT